MKLLEKVVIVLIREKWRGWEEKEMKDSHPPPCTLGVLDPISTISKGTTNFVHLRGVNADK
jgi:hypothetical protein